MKWLLIIFFLGFTVFEVDKKINSGSKGHHLKKSYRSFAVLELFTSEGCSSCPPADRLLPQLASADAKILPLSFHVDYWDRLGWKDPFSNAAFSERQRAYINTLKIDGAYTPQMIVNGVDECTGSDKAALGSKLNKALDVQASAHFNSLTATY